MYSQHPHQSAQTVQKALYLQGFLGKIETLFPFFTLMCISDFMLSKLI